MSENASLALALARPLPDGVGVVTQWFGENPAAYARFGLAGHNGIDYGCPESSAVLATHAGRCVIGNDPGGYGIYVKVLADWGYTLYGHLRGVLCVDMELVGPGTQIGYSGNTGNSTGPHLHFGWRVTGVRNPAYQDWLDPYLGRRLNGAI